MRWCISTLLGLTMAFGLFSRVAIGDSLPPVKPWLGVSISQVSRGVMVNEVIPDTPADMAGLLSGDVIADLDGIRTYSPGVLSGIVNRHKVGDEVVLRVWRRSAKGGEEFQIVVSLSKMLNEQEQLQRRLQGKLAPVFDLSRVHGKRAGKLTTHRGKVVVLEFWSSSCLDCFRSFRALSSLEAEKLGDLVVLGISTMSKAEIQTILRTTTIGISLLDDPNSMVRAQYRCTQDPCVVVIGRDGTVRHADSGPKVAWEDVLLTAKRALLDRVLLQ